MSTHMKKVEVLSILRALGLKYAERNDYEKGLNYIERAEKLSKELLEREVTGISSKYTWLILQK